MFYMTFGVITFKCYSDTPDLHVWMVIELIYLYMYSLLQVALLVAATWSKREATASK